MGDDLQCRVALAVAAQLVGGEALVHLAGALPGDDLHLGLRGDVFREILVGQEDHRVGAEALDHLMAFDEVQQMSTSAFTSADVLT